MIKDAQVGAMRALLAQGCSVANAARSLNVSENSVRKYRNADQLPSQMERSERTYRTRPDPLFDYWDEIEELLESNHRIKPYAILDWLKDRYNKPGQEEQVTDAIRRTLERRVAQWKLDKDVQKEVMFPQVHHPGDVLSFDFANMNSLSVTINRQPFDHMFFHAVLTYSNWEHLHLCHSESFEALSTGLQDAFHLAGGVPRRVRSDSLSAAIKNLSSDKEFTRNYTNLLDHYGVSGQRINVRKPHENGDVESSHGHIRDMLDQALLIRGSRDFTSTSEYLEFVRAVVAKKNQSRQPKFEQEVEQLSSLPARRLEAHSSLKLTVKSDSVIRVKQNSYSVHSKYIGLTLEVRTFQDHLELWYGNRCVEQLPRLFGKGKTRIDFRHVIDSLVRKPGAFVNYKYMAHMFPTTRFRMAYDQLREKRKERPAVKQYLVILHLAKQEGLEVVDDVLRWFLSKGKELTQEDVLDAVQKKQDVPPPTDVNVDVPDLSEFDSLLNHTEVYDDQENLPKVEIGCDLTSYDRYVETCGTTEGATVAEVSGES